MESSPVLFIVEGPPGSGKTTVVPFWLARRAGRPVVVAVPTRTAAIALASYVARRTAESPGGMIYQLPPGLAPEVYALAGGTEIPLDGPVGYAVRGRTSLPEGLEQAHVAYVTPGILVQAVLACEGEALPFFPVVDEAHLRSLEVDLLIALLLARRASFATMTATWGPEGERLSTLAAGMGYRVERLALPAIAHPVRVVEAPLGRSFRIRHPAGAVRLALDWAGRLRFGEVGLGWAGRSARIGRPGEALHILVLLPGVEEVEEVAEALEAELDNEVVRLYGAMAVGEQEQAAGQATDRSATRIFVATEVAGVSLTLNAGLVIDPGLVRRGDVDARGFVRLPVVEISRAEATQRAGRAGRTAPGICLRLFRAADLPEERPAPEIRRTVPERLVLAAAAAGRAVGDLPLLEAPPEDSLQAAALLLRRLGALDPAGGITSRGQQILALGLPARLATPLLAARAALEPGSLLLEQVVAAVALLATGRPWRLPRRGPPPGGDLETALVALGHYMATADPARAAREARALGFSDRVLDEAAGLFLPDLRERLGLAESSPPLEALAGPVDEAAIAAWLVLGSPDRVGVADWEQGRLRLLEGELEVRTTESGFWHRHAGTRPGLALILMGVRIGEHEAVATAIVPVRPEDLERTGAVCREGGFPEPLRWPLPDPEG